MKNSEVSFHGYLRREVDNAGKRFARAQQKVWTLAGAPDHEAGPALLKAVDVLGQSMQAYTGALRRLAHFANHQTQVKSPNLLSRHA